MGGLRDAVVVGDHGRGSEHDVAEAGLANVRAAMISCESLDQILGELVLAIHEDVLRGYFDILESDQSLLASIHRVALVDLAALHGSKIAALPAVDVSDALSIHRNGARNSEVLLLRVESLSGHDDHPMGVQDAGLVQLAAPKNQGSVRLSAVDMDVDVLLLLVHAILSSVALGICHGATQDKIFALGHRDELLEALMVLGAVLLIDVVGGAPHGVGCILTHASLEA
mmetsp:Transcript_64485/g.135313  ORF Transcript_64485/g.135313 Transcript_64485/m.135313 type:complete len:227 (+) Transcript_64485:729-1409(+)